MYDSNYFYKNYNKIDIDVHQTVMTDEMISPQKMSLRKNS